MSSAFCLSRWLIGAVCTLALTASAAGQSLATKSWRLKGPPGGASVRGIAVDPRDPQTVLVATPGALFRTSDGGATWTRVLNDGGPVSFYPQAFPTVRFAPSNPAFAYAMTTDWRLVRSVDGGRTWSRPGIDTVRSVSVDRLTPTVLYGLVGSVSAKSVDGGVSWQPLASNLPGYLGHTHPQVNSGDNPVQSYVASSYSFDFPGFLPTGWARVDRLEPQGTWTTILSCAFGSVRCGYFHLFEAPSDPAVVYVYATASRALKVTRTRGNSWSKASPLLDETTALTGVPSELAWLEVSPRDSGLAFAFTASGAFRTLDAGATWVRHCDYSGLDGATPFTHDYSDLSGRTRGGWAAVSWQNTGATLFVGTDGGVYTNYQPDSDGDGLLDDWETGAGLDPQDASGDNGAAGDPDRDGMTNAEELGAGTAPLTSELFFAEGATGTGLGFATRFAILNPHEDVSADVSLEFLTVTGQRYTYALPTLARAGRVTVDAGAIPALPELADAEFSTVVRSRYRVVADRTMTWNARAYGSHAGTSVDRPSPTWYLAEGATHSQFNLFYLLQNPGPTDTRVNVTYLRPAPSGPLSKVYTVPAASRFNIWVNYEDFAGLGQALASTDVSAVVQTLDGTPIIAERAMYRDVPGQVFGAGHESAGVIAAAEQWFLAEGATGPFFDLFVLVANPGDTVAEVEATYLLPGGTTLVKPYTVMPNSRFTIWVDDEDAALANTAVSTVIRSTNGAPVVVERAMWWPGGGWQEAHNSSGATTTGTTWALAEGEIRTDAAGTDTFILMANTSAYPGRATVTLFFEGGGTATRTYALPAGSRTNAWIRADFPQAANRRFGAIVESLAPVGGGPPAQIVVERAMYSDSDGVTWAAGSDALATKLR